MRVFKKLPPSLEYFPNDTNLFRKLHLECLSKRSRHTICSFSSVAFFSKRRRGGEARPEQGLSHFLGRTKDKQMITSGRPEATAS